MTILQFISSSASSNLLTSIYNCLLNISTYICNKHLSLSKQNWLSAPYLLPYLLLSVSTIHPIAWAKNLEVILKSLPALPRLSPNSQSINQSCQLYLENTFKNDSLSSSVAILVYVYHSYSPILQQSPNQLHTLFPTSSSIRFSSEQPEWCNQDANFYLSDLKAQVSPNFFVLFQDKVSLCC